MAKAAEILAVLRTAEKIDANTGKRSSKDGEAVRLILFIY
jgi:hypothetical protein